MARVLVAYFNASEPMRLAVRHHLESFGKYSKHECVYFNVARPATPSWLRDLRIDALVLHTTVLSLRWAPPHFERAVARLSKLGLRPQVVLAYPQDEFSRTEMLSQGLSRLGVTHVFSAAPSSEWSKIYRTLNRESVRFEQVLTGYLDPELLRTVDQLDAQGTKRTIDIGYRAWRAAPWLGRLGVQKVEIGERFLALTGPEVVLDVSTRNEDVFLGDDWIRFLLQCRAVLGTESGASILDATGELQERTENYARALPGATYDEIEKACFSGLDGNLKLRVIAPRHLEACATRTCQILMRGTYSDVLDADVHYVALEPDYSNITQAVEAALDPKTSATITERAYQDVVASGRFTYEHFVHETMDSVINQASDGQAQDWDRFSQHLVTRARRNNARSQRRLKWRCRTARHLSTMLRWVHLRVPGDTLAQVPTWISRVLRRQQPLRCRRLGARTGNHESPTKRSPARVVSVTPLPADRDSRARKIAASIARRGLESTLVEAERSNLDANLPSGVKRRSLRHVPRRDRDPIFRALDRMVGDCLLRPAVRVPRADVYYLHGYYQFPGIFLRSLLHRVPIIYDAHDYYPALNVRTRSSRLQHRLELWLEGACIRRSSAFITVSDGVADLYERQFGTRPVVVRNTHDERLDSPANETVRQAVGVEPSDFLIVMVGQRKEDLSVRAIAMVAQRVAANIKFAFVGPGYGPEDQAALDQLEVSDRVRFAGSVDPSAIVPFIGSADAAAVLYRPTNESVASCLPNGLFQSLAAGLPLIYAQDLLMINALVGEGAIAIDADDPERLATEIERLATDAPRREHYAKASKQIAHETGWENEERKVIAIVDNLLKTSASALAGSGS